MTDRSSSSSFGGYMAIASMMARSDAAILYMREQTRRLRGIMFREVVVYIATTICVIILVGPLVGEYGAKTGVFYTAIFWGGSMLSGLLYGRIARWRLDRWYQREIEELFGEYDEQV